LGLHFCDELVIYRPRHALTAFDRVYQFDRSYIVRSDRNEVILLENDVDTRKLFIIADASEDRRFLDKIRREQLDERPEYEAINIAVA